MTDMATVDWSELMSSWDRQQEGYLPAREERFDRMFDAVELLVGEEFLALDLACGPGSISRRLLNRFPAARAVAVDHDPLLIALGQRTLGHLDARLSWADRDLREAGWSAGLATERFDAVLSTTGLHWLTPPQLATVHRELAQILRPGGVALVGDHMPFDRCQPSLARVTSLLAARQEERAFEHEGFENWNRWWSRVGAIPALAELIAERERRYRSPADGSAAAALWAEEGLYSSRSFAGAALAQAGFAEVGTIWQQLDDYIMLAVR